MRGYAERAGHWHHIDPNKPDKPTDINILPFLKPFTKLMRELREKDRNVPLSMIHAIHQRNALQAKYKYEQRDNVEEVIREWISVTLSPTMYEAATNTAIEDDGKFTLRRMLRVLKSKFDLPPWRHRGSGKHVIPR
ncbi:hypothetical protein BGZ63DRAFT_404369 [Mariannaea sp. PMI_226]|nr:hypothetical protein BGZ63DRAFT_404369 [Mariannaea sp. PMI_226]